MKGGSGCELGVALGFGAFAGQELADFIPFSCQRMRIYRHCTGVLSRLSGLASSAVWRAAETSRPRCGGRLVPRTVEAALGIPIRLMLSRMTLRFFSSSCRVFLFSMLLVGIWILYSGQKYSR